MKNLLLIFVAFISFFSFTQQENGDCWKCILAVQNEEGDKIFETCGEFVRANEGTNSAETAKFMLARMHMENGEFKKALRRLDEIESPYGMFQAMIEGLKGDCQSELGSLSDAIVHYENAVRIDDNDLTTPYFLFKAYLISRDMDAMERAQTYLSSIQRSYPNSYLGFSVNKYITSENVPPFDIKREEIEQPTDGLGLGTVHGERIDEDTFVETYREQQYIADMNNRMQGLPGKPIDLEAVYKMVVEDILLEEAYQKLGIQLTEEEFEAYLYANNGFKPLPDLLQNFKDENGKLDRELLRARVNDLSQSSDPAQKQIWENYKNSLKERRKQEKLKMVFSWGIYSTDIDVRHWFNEDHALKSVKYWLKPYFNAGKVKVTDEELRAYYEEHKNDPEFHVMDDFHEIKYIETPIVPSRKDSSVFINSLDDLIPKFKEASNDSLFVMTHSEKELYTSGPYATAVPNGHPDENFLLFTYPEEMTQTFKGAKLGEVYGPYLNKGNLNIAKVIGFTQDSIRARHILITDGGMGTERMFRVADSLFKMVNNDNFAALAKMYSEDGGSQPLGGDLGYFFFSKMVAPFAKYCADAEVGKIGMVRTQFGMHIVQVTDRRGPVHPRVAVIEKVLVPSEETKQILKAKVEDFDRSLKEGMEVFENPYDKVEFFLEFAESKGYKPRIMRYRDSEVRNANSMEDEVFEGFLKLAYSDSSAIGNLLNEPIKTENKHFIPMLTGIKEKGIPVYEEVKDLMLVDLERQKKAQILIEEMESFSSLDKVPGKVKKTEIVLSDNNFGDEGLEAEMIGRIYRDLEDGELSEPIIGWKGVYRIQVEESTFLKDPAEYIDYRSKVDNNHMSLFTDQLMNAFKFRAQLIDNRALYLSGIRK